MKLIILGKSYLIFLESELVLGIMTGSISKNLEQPGHPSSLIRSRGYKIFFMLNSAHKC